MSFVKITEVGPRDGLQNESKKLGTDTKFEFIKKLASAGLTHIEAGSFVSHKWVPQMANSEAVIQKINQSQSLRNKANCSILVPNLQGLELAKKYKAKEIAIFISCTETFSKKNLNKSIRESLTSFEEVITLANKSKIKVRAYLSMAFGCPYEGKVSAQIVSRLVKKMINLGAYEISLGDTIGVSTPKQVRQVLKLLQKDISLKKIALHMHDTRGLALANVLQGLEMGVRSFDSSLGGLGGCPYAKGAAGNLATEKLVYMLHGMGFQTGVNLKLLSKIKPWLEVKIGKKLTSQIDFENFKFNF